MESAGRCAVLFFFFFSSLITTSTHCDCAECCSLARPEAGAGPGFGGRDEKGKAEQQLAFIWGVGPGVARFPH